MESICQKCKHFRDITPFSTLLSQAMPTNEATIGDSLSRIRETEAEISAHELNELYNKEKFGKRAGIAWDSLPTMHPYCGFSEDTNVFLIFSIKNSSHNCSDFVAGSPVKNSCSNCRHRSVAKGSGKDRRVAGEMNYLMRSGSASGTDTSSVQAFLNREHEAIARTKAREISQAFSEKGLMTSEPEYLDYCHKYSVAGRFAVCALQNHHQTCPGWE